MRLAAPVEQVEHDFAPLRREGEVEQKSESIVRVRRQRLGARVSLVLQRDGFCLPVETRARGIAAGALVGEFDRLQAFGRNHAAARAPSGAAQGENSAPLGRFGDLVVAPVVLEHVGHLGKRDAVAAGFVGQLDLPRRRTPGRGGEAREHPAEDLNPARRPVAHAFP